MGDGRSGVRVRDMRGGGGGGGGGGRTLAAIRLHGRSVGRALRASEQRTTNKRRNE